MHFLRTLFWVVIAVGMLIFAVQNNGVVTINLWGGLQADVKIWLLALGPLLLGFLPTWAFGRLNLWRERKAAREAARRAEDAALYAPPAPGGATSVSVAPHAAAAPAS